MWWIKTRRVHSILLLTLASFVILVILVQNSTVTLPSITGGSRVALSLFVPVPLVVGLMACLESRLYAPEISGVRLVSLLDLALSVATVTSAVALSVTADWLMELPQAGTAGRNTALLAGLMLCGRPLMRDAAVMIPVGWLIIVVFFGFRDSRDPYSWAIVLEPADSLHAIIAAMLTFAAGIFVQLRSARKML